ncbi:MAG: polyphosphate kinase 2 family protein [Chloroflexi bacterium]|nr:polyphosphate kinase 2 family protein [Chloroflexota bacterium]
MKLYRVKPGDRVRLRDWKPDDRSGFNGNKEDSLKVREKLRLKLEELQNLLYAEHRHRLLIVIQAMDTGGKDGTIRAVFQGVNPQGVKVASFKSPTPAERDHDYLWRVHPQIPGKGEIVIFNRSHYEDVLIVRVHDFVPPAVWKKRYAHINDFERMLTDEGVTILKFYLNIDKDEQKRRLQERLDNPEKHWKFNADDLAERNLWPQYMKAYEDMLTRTSTPWAPWHIVPSNRGWYRDLVVAQTIVDALKKLDMHYPPAPEGIDKIVID